jgi:hypothetical protein
MPLRRWRGATQFLLLFRVHYSLIASRVVMQVSARRRSERVIPHCICSALEEPVHICDHPYRIWFWRWTRGVGERALHTNDLDVFLIERHFRFLSTEIRLSDLAFAGAGPKPDFAVNIAIEPVVA